MSLGVVAPPERGIERLPGFARAAEESGLDELWLWEDCFADGGVAAAAVALAVTSRITVATGILPVPLRSAAALAMEAATLARFAPDRFVLGVGHGVQDWMARAGVRAESPVTLLREHVVAVRSLLAGETVDAAGRYVRLDSVRLDHALTSPPPVWVAGEGPRTLRTAGELGDGVILTAGTSPERAAESIALAAEGRRAVGRPGAPDVAVFVMTVVASSPVAVEAGWARLEDAWDAWGLAEGTRAGVVGSPAQIAEQLRAWLDVGVTHPVLLPVGDVDTEAFLAAAGEVAGRLTAR